MIKGLSRNIDKRKYILTKCFAFEFVFQSNNDPTLAHIDCQTICSKIVLDLRHLMEVSLIFYKIWNHTKSDQRNNISKNFMSTFSYSENEVLSNMIFKNTSGV